MPPKPRPRNWNDVQTAIATVAIVATLGLWNLFSRPAKVETVQALSSEPVSPPTEPPATPVPAVLPQVKIMFTQTAPQTNVVQQVQPKKKKNKNKDKNSSNNNGGGSVTQTKSS